MQICFECSCSLPTQKVGEMSQMASTMVERRMCASGHHSQRLGSRTAHARVWMKSVFKKAKRRLELAFSKTPASMLSVSSQLVGLLNLVLRNSSNVHNSFGCL